MALACQCSQLDPQAGEGVLTALMAAAPKDRKPAMGLAAFNLLWRAGRAERAEAAIQPALEDPVWSAGSYVWRLAFLAAEKQAKWGRAASYLDKALQIEYAAVGDKLDLQAARQDYGRLLDAYHKVAQALSTLDKEAPRDLPARIVRAADRWRSVEADETAACQGAARALAALGEGEMAWDYLTTPLAQRPNEAAPLLGLAAALRQQGDLTLADRAYASAFGAEPTNAQILWDRAQLLQQMGQSDHARQVYRQIADGAWPAQFESLKTQARQQGER